MMPIVVIGASAGGLKPLKLITKALPIPSLAAIFVVVHTGAQPSILPEILNFFGEPLAIFAQDGAAIAAGRIYVAPPDTHVLLELGQMRLSHGPKEHHTRPAADPLFKSAAIAYRERVMGVVLSGGGSDGAEGLRAIKAGGGLAIVQEPNEARDPSMPLAALQRDHPDAFLAISEIALVVAAFCSNVRPLPFGVHH